MRYQICVSGAASGETVEASHQLSYDLGVAIAEAGKTLTTGATIGLPWYAAQGFVGVKDRKGFSIGYSPASSFREHIITYKLPTVEFDYINFTSLDYVGRNVHLVHSSDALITVGGRMGSLHEFATAIESHKVVGVLLGSGGLADFIPTLLQNIEAPGGKAIIYDVNPSRLVEKVIAVLDVKYAGFKHDGTDSHISRFSVNKPEPQNPIEDCEIDGNHRFQPNARVGVQGHSYEKSVLRGGFETQVNKV